MSRVSQDRSNREETLAALLEAGRELGAAEIMFHSAIAARAGLSATEHKAMDYLVRADMPVTAGDLADRTGLTTGAITGLVDRLEAAGYARRVQDPSDRRRVIIEPIVEELGRKIGPLFQGLTERMEELHARYGDAELALVLDYLTRVSAVLHQETLKLRAGGDATSDEGERSRRRGAPPGSTSMTVLRDE